MSLQATSHCDEEFFKSSELLEELEKIVAWLNYYCKQVIRRKINTS